ncbi:MAG: dihydrofolate reductase [Bacteroidales bacterium]|jgi:dihydrofolate reductase
MNIIVAVAKNNAIGKNNNLLWHIKEDLVYFKKTTLGATVVMGRKTFESIGKPLPGRRNVVVSKTMNEIEGIEIFRSIDQALGSCSSNEEVFIIGGGEIYKQSISLVQRIFLTIVDVNIPDADTFFPELDMSQWREVFREDHSRGVSFEHPFSFIVLDRVN